MKYEIGVVRKLGVNQFSEEESVGTVEADLLGPAKRLASEYIHFWLLDRKIAVRNQKDWAKDVRRGCQSREIMATENGKLVILIFLLHD